MREIEEQIEAWRIELEAGGSFDRATVRELESHLREVVEAELADGAKHEEVFDIAVSQLGTLPELEEEFAKVYPAASWARRVLWMVAGYGLVKLTFILAFWIGTWVQHWRARVAAGEMVTLPFALKFEHGAKSPNRLLAEGVHMVDQIPVASLFGAASQLLVLGLFCLIAARVVLGKARWLERLLFDGNRVALVAVGSCVLLQLFRNAWVAPWVWSHLKTRGFHLNLEGKSAESAEVTLHKVLDSWLGDCVNVASSLLLLVFAIWCFRRLRQRSVGGRCAWVVAGYFVLSGLVHLVTAVGVVVAMIVAAYVPALSVLFARHDQVDAFSLHYFWTPGAQLALAVQLALVVLVLVWMGRVISRKHSLRADGLSDLMIRRSTGLFGVWALLYTKQFWMRAFPKSIWEPVSEFTPVQIYSPGALIGLVLAAVVIAISMPKPKFPKPGHAAYGDDDEVFG